VYFQFGEKSIFFNLQISEILKIQAVLLCCCAAVLLCCCAVLCCALCCCGMAWLAWHGMASSTSKKN
jgi:hypothetical protein